MTEFPKDSLVLDELAHFGDGVLAYIKQISQEDAKELIGEMPEFPVDMELYCLFAADGTPLAISDSHETAFENAVDHDLEPIDLH